MTELFSSVGFVALWPPIFAVECVIIVTLAMTKLVT